MKQTLQQNNAFARRRSFPWLLVVALGPLAIASAQGVKNDPWAPAPEQGDQDDKDNPETWLHPANNQSPKDPQKQIVEAFHRVERSLDGMSLLLLEASKGDTSRLLNAKGSGIEDLLKLAENRPQGDPSNALSELLYATSSEGQNVLKGIDEILEIAAKNGHPNSANPSQSKPSNQGQGEGEGQDPKNQQSQKPSQQQSQSGQKQMQGAEKPTEDGQDPSQGETPKSNQPMEGDPNQPKSEGNNAPNPDGTGPEQAVLPGRESWGNLPIHVRDIFRADGEADMPARYRRWIDSYYRKLNQDGQR